MGVKGVLPLGCLPLWGREGVTLLYTEEVWQVTGKRGFFQSPIFNCIGDYRISCLLECFLYFLKNAITGNNSPVSRGS